MKIVSNFPDKIILETYNFFLSAQQGSSDEQLFPTHEQDRRLYVDAVLRDAHLQLKKLGGAEHHLRQLRTEVRSNFLIY